MESVLLKNITITACVLVLAGCGAKMPIQKIGGTENDYVLNREDNTTFGHLSGVKKDALDEAILFCSNMGKKFVEKYSIDKERAFYVWPETTLFFSCVDAK